MCFNLIMLNNLDNRHSLWFCVFFKYLRIHLYICTSNYVAKLSLIIYAFGASRQILRAEKSNWHFDFQRSLIRLTGRSVRSGTQCIIKMYSFEWALVFALHKYVCTFLPICLCQKTCTRLNTLPKLIIMTFKWLIFRSFRHIHTYE